MKSVQRWIVPFATLAAIVLVSGCSSPSTSVSGEVLVQWRDGVLGLEGAKGHGGMDCFTSGGFDDVKEGAEVLILNGEGNPIAKGKLGKGATSDEDSHICVFPFEVSEVPLKGDFFSVQISHRGGPTYDRDEITEPLSLSLL